MDKSLEYLLHHERKLAPPGVPVPTGTGVTGAQACSPSFQYNRVRALLFCPRCHGGKDAGLLLCWPCHQRQKRAYGGDYSKRVYVILNMLQTYLETHTATEALAYLGGE